MPNFHYKAINKDGNLEEGSRSSKNEFDLNKELKIEDLTLISATEIKEDSVESKLSRMFSFGRISIREKIVFNRNLASMIGAGLTLTRALTILERQSKNKKFKGIISSIIEDIKKGSSLSASFLKFPKVFSPLLVAMVQAGEESGKLIESLNTVSEQMEKTYELTKKIKGAMVYPGVIIFAMLVIGVFMMIYIVPTLTKTFVELNIELPASTRFIILISDVLKNHFLLFIGAIFVFMFGIISIAKTSKGKKFLDWFVLEIPVIGEMVKETNSARTTRTMASLLSSGVSFVQSVRIVHDVIQNSYYKEILKKAEKNVELGLPISQTFIQSEKFYPVFVGEMIAVGEETGELGAMLYKVASFYEEEVDQKTKNLSTIVEPVLMIVVGTAVGFFAISMISPMYSLVDNL